MGISRSYYISVVLLSELDGLRPIRAFHRGRIARRTGERKSILVNNKFVISKSASRSAIPSFAGPDDPMRWAWRETLCGWKLRWWESIEDAKVRAAELFSKRRIILGFVYGAHLFRACWLVAWTGTELIERFQYDTCVLILVQMGILLVRVKFLSILFIE